MKRFTPILLTVVIIAMLAVAATPARADWPTTKALTLSGGSTNVVSVDYDKGIGQDVYTSFKILSLEYQLATATTTNGTISLRRASGGPAYFTATVTSNTTVGVSFVTNEVYFLRGDDFHVTSSVTNAGTVTIIGKEQ